MKLPSADGFESRSRARRRALQALYQWRINPRNMAEIIEEFEQEQDFSNVDITFFKRMCSDIVEQQETLDSGLKNHVDRPIKQLDVMERVILQIGFFELLHDTDTPARVIIDECVDLAHRFGADQGHAFINGVLDKAARSVRQEELSASKLPAS